MSIELHMTIKADTALDCLRQLADVGLRAAQELGGGRPAPTTQHKDPELPLPATEMSAGAVTDKPVTPRKRTTAPTTAPKADAPKVAEAQEVDRNEVIKGLTDLYMAGDPAIRDKITAFRDGHRVQRLRELKDDALPEAAKLLGELQAAVGP